MLPFTLGILIILHNIDGLRIGSDRFTAFADFCLQSQQNIIQQLEAEENCSRFLQDKWNKGSGYGITAVLERGDLLEKGAVSTTITKGSVSICIPMHYYAY
jgi:coproporphyrinogen III oxidase